MVNLPKGVSRFVSRNLISIVMIPSIIAFHIGWSTLQKNRTLVREDKEIDLPIITLYKYVLKNLTDNEGETKATDAKVEGS